MNLEEALATSIRNRRIELGLSQEELAHRCEIDRTYIGLIERQKRKPTLHILFKICQSLDILPSTLMKEVEELMEL